MTAALINSLLSTLLFVLDIYMWIIIVAALLTWVRPDPYNPIVQALWRLTEPVYRAIRRIVPTMIGGIDIAPIIIIVIIKFLTVFIQNLMQPTFVLG